MRILVLTVLWISTCVLSIAQTKPKPKVLQSGRILPNDFTTDSSVKYEKEIKQISKNAKRKDAKNQDKFYLESNFLIDDFLKSGYVLFDDPASKYITKVGRKILDQIPSRQRPQISFYAVKSSAVNAFATNSGLVFVNVGLLARLENEAQLAFILAHEITHVIEKHNLDLFLEQKKLEKGNRREYLNRNADVNSILLKKNIYSRELEFEADEGGIEYFLKTKYDLDAALQIFDILRYARLPATNDTFDWAYFEDEGLRFPSEFILDKVQKIGTLNYSDDDSKSTHPSINKRKAKIREALKNKESDERKPFLVSEKTFEIIKEQAINSLVDYYLRDFDYYDAIYTASQLIGSEKYRNQKYEYNIGQALSAIVKLRNADEFDDFEVDHEKIEGESQRVFRLVNKMSDEDINILAVNYLWRLVEKYPKDDMILDLANGVTQSYFAHHQKDIKKFNTTFKFDKKDMEEYTAMDYRKNALVATLKNSKFKSAMVKNKRIAKSIKQYKSDKKEKPQTAEFEKKVLHGKFALGQKSVIVVNPYFSAYNFKKKKDNFLFLKSEEKQESLSDLVKNCAKKNKVRAIVLDVSDLNRNTSGKFVDQAELNTWFNQLLSLGGEDVTPYNQEAVEAIADKYGTDYVMWTGVVSGKIRGKIVTEFVGNAMFNFPWAIVRIFKRPQRTTVLTVVANVKTQNVEMLKFAGVNMDANSGFVESHIYDSFYQLQKKPKK